jgi:DNA-binding response OmpR family regulator
MSKILVIDDSRSALQLVEMILVEAGHDVCAFTDGKCAHEALAQQRFDLIITDIYMPNKDGLEVIREERRTEPKIPIIAVSGVTGKLNMLATAKRLGARSVLQKPFSKAELLAAIDEALRVSSSDKTRSSLVAGNCKTTPRQSRRVQR